jgi:hypothetical protein
LALMTALVEGSSVAREIAAAWNPKLFLVQFIRVEYV